MRYELFLRRPSQPLTDEELAAAAAAVAREEGGGLHLDPYRDEQGAAGGLDLGVAVEEPAGAVRLCRAAFALAAAHRLTVFDPQLGRTVVAGDEELIRQQVERARAFATAASISGASGGGGAGGLSPGARLWLALLGVIALVLLLGRALRC